MVDHLFRQNEGLNKQNPVGPTAGRKMPKAPVTGPQTTPAADSLTFIDLFSGCGGFSLGLEWAGLRCLAAIDSNESAIGTFKRNHPEVAVALVKDLTKFSPKELDKTLGSDRVDVIVGGPAVDGDLAELIGRIQLTTAYTYDVAFRLLMPPVEEPESTKPHGLSNRELEVLQWVAAGKTAWEAGVILSISENTVNKHLASCIEKLKCVNRVQAVARAVNEKLIQL